MTHLLPTFAFLLRISTALACCEQYKSHPWRLIQVFPQSSLLWAVLGSCAETGWVLAGAGGGGDSSWGAHATCVLGSNFIKQWWSLQHRWLHFQKLQDQWAEVPQKYHTDSSRDAHVTCVLGLPTPSPATLAQSGFSQVWICFFQLNLIKINSAELKILFVLILWNLHQTLTKYLLIAI